MEWWPLHTMGAFANMTVFLTWNGLTLFNFFRAAFRGPGLVPEGWTPVRFLKEFLDGDCICKCPFI